MPVKFKFYWHKSKIAFCATLWGTSGVTYTVYLALESACLTSYKCYLTIFASTHGQGTISKYWSKSLCSKGVGHLERKFQGEWGIIHQRQLASENKSPCIITWHCLGDPTFSRFGTIPACDRQTDGEIRDDG